MHKECLVASLILLLLQGVITARLKMEPRNMFVLPGQNLSILCEAGHPFLYCRIKLPGLRNALLLSQKTKPTREYAYYGSGLTNGQCGVTLFNVGDRVNGEISCTAAALDEVEESSGETTLTVLRSPKSPELAIVPSASTGKSTVFKEGDILQATCAIRDARPVASMTWYLGRVVLKGGIRSEVTTDEKTDLHSIKQMLVRRLSWEDDSKELSCVAGHLALGPKNQTSKTFNVTYAPKYVKMPIELFGFIVNQTGNVTVEVMANPKPTFIWIVGNTQLAEGQKGGNLEATRAELSGHGRWKVVLRIHKVTTEDVKREYYLKASNSDGQRTYRILISTKSGPEFVLGMGIIIAIVVGGVLLLAVAIIAYVFISGRRQRQRFVPSTRAGIMSKVTVDATASSGPYGNMEFEPT